MTDNELETLIETNLGNATKAIVQSPDNVHFEAIVISELFKETPNKVKQQRMVYEALGNKIETGEVHALSLKTYTPTMWEKINNK
ncbi:BolA/IbaG family iron-sulfur metabolism protein [Francisellaceae bacterium]|jgi:acid stress-induced BolA-like protein IbaG/YrbA|nr:BolA/IbaG family iron-sulfur metabolism protein [Francisellaceae bacterium]